MMQNNKLLHKLRKREVVIGPFTIQPNQPSMNCWAGRGFDFAIIDLEIWTSLVLNRLRMPSALANWPDQSW